MADESKAGLTDSTMVDATPDEIMKALLDFE